MGDGGVACMHLQHSNIMDRFPIQDAPNSPTLTTSNANSASATAVSVPNSTANNATTNENNCNGSSTDNNNNISVSSNNGNGSGNVKTKSNGVNSKPKRIVKKIIKVKKLISGKKVVVERTEVKSEKKLVENGTTSSVGIVRKSKVDNKAVEVKEENKTENTKDEVEEGELGTLKWPPPKGEVENGEFVPPEKTRRSEIEKGEVVGEKWRKGEVEKGEIVAGSKWRKAEVGRDEIEKGEFIPDRWHVKDEYNYSKARGRYDSFRERTPPFGKYSVDEIYRRKELSRSGSSQQNKSLARWEFAQEKNIRLSSKIVDEEGVYKGEYDNGKSYGREYMSSGNRLKRHGADSDGSERKNYADYVGSKSRRLSDDTTRSGNPEHYSHHSVDRFHRNSSSSRVLSLEKYSLRHHEPTLSSKVVYDRHPHSPGYSERSPHDRARFYDYRDRSPVRRERSPYSREKSPYGRDRSPCGRERSPYGRERTPYGRERSPHGREKSPYGRDRSPYGKERTPYGRARSPHGREKSPYGRERTPYGGERTPYGRERSPYVREKSPYGREKSPYVRDRSPYGRERSPYGRSHHYDHRNRSPTNSERSPYDRARIHDRRDRTPSYLEKSPLDRGRPSKEGSRKGGTNEKHGSEHGNKVQDDKLGHKVTAEKDYLVSTKESPDKIVVNDVTPFDEKIADGDTHKEEQSQSPSTDNKESPHAVEPPVEDLQSMEEDMDICDTPPHVTAPVVADTVPGKWYYLDYFGVERGPSKLSDLKMLVSEGFLASDHMVKHFDSDRWVTAENAVSPLVTVNFQTVVSESVTQLVTPPEAPGNLLEDSGDIGQSVVLSSEESPAMLDSKPLKDLHIDERVGALLDGFTVIPGREVETIGEILHTTFENVHLEEWGKSEDFACHNADDGEDHGQTSDELLKSSDIKAKEDEGSISLLGDGDHEFASFVGAADWFSDRWSCKGGDWKRNDETVQERFSRRKLVLNDGFPLCQMPKAGSEDPRWHRKDDLYYPSQSRRLDLPPWAFSCSDERNELGVVGRATVNKPPITKVVKGTMLPVVRINACVVKDHGSFVSEPRMKVRGKDRYLSRSARAQSATGEAKRSTMESDSRSTMESDSRSTALHGQESSDSWRSGALIRIPKDRLCTVDDLQLRFGEWYYLDGTGHERGPLSFSDLQVLAGQGIIQKHSSVYRKLDRVWVPINSILEATEVTLGTDKDSVVPSSNSSLTLSKSQSAAMNGGSKNTSSFHSSHPQFVGYTRGKLHELVMKSFKSREFAAAINEVLDPWIIAKQPKKEGDKHIYRRSETDARGGKRYQMQVDDSDEDYEMEEDIQKDETPFEDLCSDANFCEVQGSSSESEIGNWGLLDGHMLARVFHFLRSDIKSLALASLTCKHWRAAVSFYKAISRQVDFSSMGPKCTDSIIWSVMDGYNKEKVTSMVLFGCLNISSAVLDEILRSFPCLSSVDISGCSQLIDLPIRFPNISWVKRCLPGVRSSEESSSRIRTLKQLSEKTLVSYKPTALGGDFDLKEYFDSVNKRDSANQFRGSLYRRSKLLDARKSSSIISRDARMKRWAMKKSANGYKRMEGFLASGLKDIMKENIFDFFVPKVAEIEDRMKNGYYLGHGLKSVKEDISRMCRDAIKAKNRGGGDMNHITTLFLKLASHLEESSKFSYERDELMKSWKDDLSAELGSASMKYKKKLVSERKFMSRSNGVTYSNGGFDYGEYASDREIRKRLSKLNRKLMDSGSETSDEFDKSSEYGKSNGESTASDTESDLDFQSESRIQESKDGYFTADESYDGMGDEREWGARMTKASLVPPVTRKYNVIDHYVIVADEEDVKRKMSVSLPDNYAEKLEMQKNGTEELELPEVKDFKPRKQLGDEVIEQEVYGIDPYTYNLLLDSMPDEVDMSPEEKHLFIEDVILRTLNKQVRHFTGTGNTPMTYPLLPVVEQIEQDADEDGDVRIIKLCRGILKAIDSRPDDNYVAYRKGLGVVCNKEGGFGEEDFVVEFLGEVYPVWKWFEKQDGIRSLQKDSKEPAPEFYNIYLERPKGDADGYDLVVVDAMHKANYASRICHSCKPNCEAKVTAVDGQYQIGIYAVHEIQYGEEVTFDYNSVTESKEEYEASVCLCGSQVCRGSYLNLTGEGAFQKIMKEWHGMLDRCSLMLEACDLNCVSEEDYLDLGRAGLGSCLLGGLPDWVVAYSARLVRFINLERAKLPEEILRHNIEEKRKYFLEVNLDTERQVAEIEAEGVHNQRLQNLALTLDKVRYVMRCVFGDPKKAPPPLEKLSPEETVSFVWKGEGSLVEELLQCMAPHLEANVLNDLKSEICANDPSDSHNVRKELQKSLLWLRDAIRCLPCTHKCRHDAAADLIHVYAYTKYFFRIREYSSFTSPPLYISPLDLGPKYADKVGADGHEYQKTYGDNYCLGQLIFWHLQTNADPDCNLARASRGCLSLPDIGSFYSKAQKPSQQRIYGPKTVKTMLERMEKFPQKPWPKDQIWSFKSSPKILGTPMFDSVIDNTTSLDKEMLHWLKHKQSG